MIYKCPIHNCDLIQDTITAIGQTGRHKNMILVSHVFVCPIQGCNFKKPNKWRCGRWKPKEVQMPRLCNNKIEVQEGRVVVYCALPEGHTGQCDVQDKSIVKKQQCDSVSSTVFRRCGLPKNHTGRHKNGIWYWD